MKAKFDKVFARVYFLYEHFLLFTSISHYTNRYSFSLKNGTFHCRIVKHTKILSRNIIQVSGKLQAIMNALN